MAAVAWLPTLAMSAVPTIDFASAACLAGLAECGVTAAGAVDAPPLAAELESIPMLGITKAKSVIPVKPAQLALDPRTRPAWILPMELAEYESLPIGRKRMIELALNLARDSPWLPYLAGGSAPSDGGFDCSGAISYLLRKAGLTPPRSSAAQAEWLRKHHRLHEVAADAVDLKSPSLVALRPGDLLFWAVSATPGTIRVHHVAMYLGTAAKDGRPLMINSTDGRSYRGQKADGYGLSDFRVPKPESLSKLVSYGPPPGMATD